MKEWKIDRMWMRMWVRMWTWMWIWMRMRMTLNWRWKIERNDWMNENEWNKSYSGANTLKINLSGVTTSYIAVPFDPLEQGILYGHLNDWKIHSKVHAWQLRKGVIGCGAPIDQSCDWLLNVIVKGWMNEWLAQNEWMIERMIVNGDLQQTRLKYT